MAAWFLCTCLRLLNGSTLHTAAPNPRARTNGVSVSPVSSPRGREGRGEGGGPGHLQPPTPFLEASITLTISFARATSPHLPDTERSPSPKCSSGPCLLQGPTWMCPPWARRKHVPNPLANGPSQDRWGPEWKEPVLTKRIMGLQLWQTSHVTLGKALPLQASVSPPVPRRVRLISPRDPAGNQSVCDTGFWAQPSQLPGPCPHPTLQRRKKGDWRKCRKYWSLGQCQMPELKTPYKAEDHSGQATQPWSHSGQPTAAWRYSSSPRLGGFFTETFQGSIPFHPLCLLRGCQR